MRLSLIWLTLVLMVLALPSRSGAADRYVDLELVLAVDVSMSMDADELRLQREGYAAAFRHPDVIDAIKSGLHGRISVTYVEWAGPATQQVIVPWSAIDGDETANDFALALERSPINGRRGTSISGGLLYAADLFDKSGVAGLRRVIDISGDGPNNRGWPVEDARDKIVGQGIAINGLPLTLKEVLPGAFYNIEDLDIYYEDCVVGGPGAFVIPVHDRAHLARAIRQKLVLEIAGRQPEILPATGVYREPRIDCMIGEKLRALRWRGLE